LQHFYAGKLLDAAEVLSHRARPFHQLRLFAPYTFVDVCDGECEKTKNASYRNDMEARLVCHLVSYLHEHHPDVTGSGCESVGVVSPYNGQVKHIRVMLKSKLGADAVSSLDVHSVDGFQGREKEVIIFSCVRAGPGGLGFLKDTRRLNVAITRAKSLLVVLGARAHAAARPDMARHGRGRVGAGLSGRGARANRSLVQARVDTAVQAGRGRRSGRCDGGAARRAAQARCAGRRRGATARGRGRVQAEARAQVIDGLPLPCAKRPSSSPAPLLACVVCHRCIDRYQLYRMPHLTYRPDYHNNY
jgi:hypothetical protein